MALVDTAREPHWYQAGGVPDTMDGRFDMLSSIVALALIRIEGDGKAANEEAVALTEVFIDDMDGSLRQSGVGDLMVGKHMGKLMGALGGRMDAYRDALQGDDNAALAEAVRRNIFRGEEVPIDSVAHVSAGLKVFHDRLTGTDSADILKGTLGA